MSNVILAQVDTAQVVQADTLQVAQPDTTVQTKGKKEKKEDKKRKDEFIPFVGVNFNQLGSSDDYESAFGVGYHIGFDYKRGKFFYWQVGARFANSVYDLTNNSDSTESISVKDIDLAVTGGINFLSAINRLIALRLFVSAVPAFTIDVGDNDFGIEKDDVNSFIMYGQAGLGVNVAFLVIETGYNFGFQDVFKDIDSKPGQIFVNVGFRF